MPVRVQPPADTVVAAVLPGRAVHRHDHEFGDAIAVQVGNGHPGALVLPEVPVRDGGPWTPGGHRAVGPQRAATVIALVTAVRRVHHEDYQIEAPVAARVRDSDVRSLVGPGKPDG